MPAKPRRHVWLLISLHAQRQQVDSLCRTQQDQYHRATSRPAGGEVRRKTMTRREMGIRIQMCWPGLAGQETDPTPGSAFVSARLQKQPNMPRGRASTPQTWHDGACAYDERGTLALVTIPVLGPSLPRRHKRDRPRHTRLTPRAAHYPMGEERGERDREMERE